MEAESNASRAVDWIAVMTFDNELQARHRISKELGKAWRFGPNPSTQYKSSEKG